MNKVNQLGEAPVRSLFFKYYMPTLVSLLSITLHQVVNGIILGHYAGKEGLAAVGLYGPIVIVFIALTLPVMIGGGILISKNIGAGSYDKVQRIFQFTTTLALVFGGIISLAAPFIAAPIASLLAGSEHTIIVNNLSDYMLWQLISIPFFFLRMFWGNFLRSDGAPNASKNGNLIAVVLNIILDVVLVIGLDMGVKGASIATAISIFAGTLYLFFYIQQHKGHFDFRNFTLSLKFAEWKQLFSYGFPTFVSEISFSAGLLIISHSVIPYGATAVAAFGLVNYISFIFLRIFTAAMIAILPIMSFNIGAKLPLRVLAILKFSLLFTLVVGIVVAALGFFIPDMLVILFSGGDTTEFRQVTEQAITLYFILFIAAGPNYILSAYFQSIKKTGLSIIINILKGVVFIWLLLLILPEYFNLGLSGIWLSRSLAEILTLVMIVFYTFIKREQYYSKQTIDSIG